MTHAVPPCAPVITCSCWRAAALFFPALVAAIDAAHREVLLETYIFDFTGSGADVAYALERAARRGVSWCAW